MTNHLPCAVNVDELRLKLTTPQGEQFWFLSAATTLHEGVNDLRAKSLVCKGLPSCLGHYSLFLQADVKGSVVLDTFQIRLSHILFQYSLRDVLERKTSWSPEALAGSSCRILTIPQDPLAFSVSFEQAQHCKRGKISCHKDADVRTVRLGKRRQVVLVLQTGRHDVQEAEVTVQDPAQRAEFDWLEVTSDIGEACCRQLSRPVLNPNKCRSPAHASWCEADESAARPAGRVGTYVFRNPCPSPGRGKFHIRSTVSV